MSGPFTGKLIVLYFDVFLEVVRWGRNNAAISSEAHVKHAVCGRRAPPADLLESCHLMAKKNSGVTRQRRGFNHRPERPDVMVNCECGRRWSMRIDTRKRLQRLSPPAQGSITANTQSAHHSAPVHLQTSFSSLPLVTEHTKTRWEPEPT